MVITYSALVTALDRDDLITLLFAQRKLVLVMPSEIGRGESSPWRACAPVAFENLPGYGRPVCQIDIYRKIVSSDGSPKGAGIRPAVANFFVFRLLPLLVCYHSQHQS